MMPSTVCFGARDDSYGFSRTSKAGNIITFKLTCKSGYVTCHSSNPSYQSKWGCLQNRLIPNQMATLITDKNAIFSSQRVISSQIIGTASFTACLGPQPNHHNCFLIISLPCWRWKRAKNSKSGTVRTCSNGVMALMGSKKRVLQCIVCMFEQSPKLQSKLKKRVPKLLFMPLLLQYQITATHYYMVYRSIYFQDRNPFEIQHLELLHVLGY